MAYCIGCGFELGAEERFCAACGSGLGQARPMVSKASTTSTEPVSRSSTPGSKPAPRSSPASSLASGSTISGWVWVAAAIFAMFVLFGSCDNSPTSPRAGSSEWCSQNGLSPSACNDVNHIADVFGESPEEVLRSAEIATDYVNNLP